MSNPNELYHHGILGQKWGVRRFQNPDGSLTTKGKKRYGTVENLEKVKAAKKAVKAAAEKQKFDKRTQKEVAKYERKAAKKGLQINKKKSISEMSDEELNSKIERLGLEKKYKEAVRDAKTVSNGKKFVNRMAKNVLAPVGEDLGRQVLKSFGAKGINKIFEEVLKQPDLEKVYANNKKKDK